MYVKKKKAYTLEIESHILTYCAAGDNMPTIFIAKAVYLLTI